MEEGHFTQEQIKEEDDLIQTEDDLYLRELQQKKIQAENCIPHPSEGEGSNIPGPSKKKSRKTNKKNKAVEDIEKQIEDAKSMRRIANPESFRGLHRIQISLCADAIIPFRDVHLADDPRDPLEAQFLSSKQIFYLVSHTYINVCIFTLYLIWTGMSFKKNGETPDLAPDLGIFTIVIWVDKESRKHIGAKVLAGELCRGKFVRITNNSTRNALVKMADIIHKLKVTTVKTKGKFKKDEIMVYGVGGFDFPVGPAEAAAALDEAVRSFETEAETDVHTGEEPKTESEDEDKSINSGVIGDDRFSFTNDSKEEEIPSDTVPTRTADSEKQADDLGAYIVYNSHTNMKAEEVLFRCVHSPYFTEYEARSQCPTSPYFSGF